MPALPNQGWRYPSPCYLPATEEIAVLRVTRQSGKLGSAVRRSSLENWDLRLHPLVCHGGLQVAKWQTPLNRLGDAAGRRSHGAHKAGPVLQSPSDH